MNVTVEVEVDKETLLRALGDQDLIDEMEERGLMPEPECDCEEPEEPFETDPMQKEAMFKAIELLRVSGDISSAMHLEEILEQVR
jgi:hypothetical protein